MMTKKKRTKIKEAAKYPVKKNVRWAVSHVYQGGAFEGIFLCGTKYVNCYRIDNQYDIKRKGEKNV